MSISSDSNAEVKVVTCSACPGFGQVYTPGLATTESGRYVNFQFKDANTIQPITVFNPGITTTGNVGINTDIITGINTDGIIIGQDLQPSTIVSYGTSVTSIGIGIVNISNQTLNSVVQIGVAFTFGAYNSSSFTTDDIGAKIIAPSIYNAYISGIDNDGNAQIKGFGGVNTLILEDRDIGGSLVYDRVVGIATTIPINSPYPYQVRLSNYNTCAASDFAFTGSKIEIQFINPNNIDDYSHFSDFLIGVTNIKPEVAEPDTLNGFTVGSSTTSILPNSNILFAEYTHSYALVDQDGTELSESWWDYEPPIRLGISRKIRRVTSTAGGICSKVTINVEEPFPINNVNEYPYNPQTNTPDGNVYVEVQGNLPQIDYNGGQIAIWNNQTETATPTNSTFVGIVSTYLKKVGVSSVTYSYIQISQTLGNVGSDFSIAIRPVSVDAAGISGRGQSLTGITTTKLYNYNPFPLYLVAKLKDNAIINNISIKETIGDFQRTIAPKWYVTPNIDITNANGNTDNSGSAPTNFKEITRLSSALIDNQNEQNLRPYVERDTFYVGANETKVVDMKKIFGTDRRVVTPDITNTEATFVVSKKIGTDNNNGMIEASLNFKEI